MPASFVCAAWRKACKILDQGGAILERLRRPIGAGWSAGPIWDRSHCLGIAACAGEFARNGAQAKAVNGDWRLERTSPYLWQKAAWAAAYRGLNGAAASHPTP